MDDVVFLAGHELRLRRHQAPAARERRIQRERIGAVGELALGETQGVGDRAGEVEVAVAAVAVELVDFFAARERGLVPAADQPRVVDRFFILGQRGLGEQRRPGRECGVLGGGDARKDNKTTENQAAERQAAGVHARRRLKD